MSYSSGDGHQNRIPADVLDILLASTKRTRRAKAMIRECLVKGRAYYAVAAENGVTRQYVQQACNCLLADYKVWMAA